MADYTSRVSERMYPLDVENADSHGAGTVNGTWVLMRDYHRAWLVIDVGDMVQGATLNAGLQEATTAGGGGAQAIANKTITALTQAGGDSDSIVCIELQTEEMDAQANYDYIRYYVTVANAAVEYSVVLYGLCSRFDPVAVANWTEIVG